MNKNQKIEVFSSYANDIVIDDTTGETRQQLGGPAKYIVEALELQKVPYTVRTNDKIVVEIHKDRGGETGLVAQSPPSRKTTFSSDWVIVSTVLNEWRFDEPLPPYLFVDIQGFVRARNSDKKQACPMLEQLAGKIYCLKGTKREIAMLSKEARDRQKQIGLLISTDGGQAVEIWSKGDRILAEPPKISRALPDTIGAGDTWLANFVAQLFAGRSVPDAASLSSQQMAKFLEAKT
jgi:hypothetical protein